MSASAAVSAAIPETPAPRDLADVIQDVMPSVVTIEVSERKKDSTQYGSGFVYDAARGYIITNFHVIDAGKGATAKVVFADRQWLDAKIVGSDKLTDIAVLQVKSQIPLSQPALGDSATLRVGNDAVAMGSPFGSLYGTVTKGIVSTLHRHMDSDKCENYIQVDAAINHGNSGGPLFNPKGEVIGVNSAIVSKNGGFSGIGLSIPINEAKAVADKIIAGEKIHWGSIGVQLDDVGDAAAKKAGLDPHRGGALIDELQPGSPAKKAGLAKNDIILSINGQPVREPHDLSCATLALPIHAQANLTYWHNRRERHASVGTVEYKEPVVPEPKKPRPARPPHAPAPGK